MSANKPLHKNVGNDENFIRHIINEMDEIIYVSDPATHDLLFLNDFGKKTFNIPSCEGMKCHEALHGLSAPCPFCKNAYLSLDEYFVWELPVGNSHHYLIRDKLIVWDKCLLRMGIANDIIQNEMISQSISRKLKNEQILLKCIHVLGNKDEFSDAVNIILKHLGEYYAADRAFVFEYKMAEDGEMLANNTHEWCAMHAASHMALFQDAPVDMFSLWKNQIEQNCNIVIESAEAIKDIHPSDYAVLKKHGIHSMMLVPLNVDDQVTGFIGVDNPGASRNDCSLLNSLALVVANEQKKREMAQRLLEMSYTDKLTGLGNRNNYMQTLEQLSKTVPPNIGVVFIDLNGLKKVNDQYGHDAGDAYIKNLADVFRKHFREEDIFRIGGDEFVFLTQRIRESVFLEKINVLRKEAHALYPDSISLGYVWREKNIRLESMIKRADFLMYENKKAYYEWQNAKKSG